MMRSCFKLFKQLNSMVHLRLKLDILLDASSCGLTREAIFSLFPRPEMMPFNFKYNLNIDHM